MPSNTMQITRSQLAHYREKGWVAVEGVFTPAVMEEALHQIMELAGRSIKATDGSMRVDRSADGQAWGPRKVADVFCASDYFRHFLFPSPVPALIAQLAGCKPLLLADEFFFKPPRHGSPKPYHQDNAYFEGKPADHLVNAWIAFDDADESNGCLRYINGSHREPILPSYPVPGAEYNLTPDPAMIDLAREELAPVGKGGVVFHHGDALHFSGPNRSDRWRRAYATFWVGADVTVVESSRQKAYYAKEELWRDLPPDSRAGMEVGSAG